MSELKCCPFCGGEAYTDKIGKPLFTIRCTNINCYCEISKNSLEDAINAWNTRKPLANIVEKLEEESYETTDTVCGGRFKAIRLSSAINIVKQEINNGLE